MGEQIPGLMRSTGVNKDRHIDCLPLLHRALLARTSGPATYVVTLFPVKLAATKWPCFLPHLPFRQKVAHWLRCRLKFASQFLSVELFTC